MPDPPDASGEFIRRLHRDRTEVAPWLNSTSSLNKAQILEIGRGEGASTVALAEQGATVIGLDVEDDAIDVPRSIVSGCGLEATFHCHNAASLRELGLPALDWIIFWASLEHMTHEERLSSLAQAWELLRPGGLLTVIETPNRLWPHDSHTSLLPFYSWLPDDLAFAYAPRSPRNGFGGDTYSDSSAQMMSFLRRGRGFSYHEVDLAIGDHRGLTVRSCMQIERRKASPARAAGWMASGAGATERVLRHYARGTDREWLQPFLYLTIEKPS